MKTDFRARPVYLSRKDRIEAHFLSCFIALLIYRVLRLKMLEILPEQEACGESILQTLRDMNFYDLQGEGFVPAYTRTALTDALHEHFAFRTDTQIVPKNVMEKIFSQTKKTNITGK